MDERNPRRRHARRTRVRAARDAGRHTRTERDAANHDGDPDHRAAGIRHGHAVPDRPELAARRVPRNGVVGVRRQRRGLGDGLDPLDRPGDGGGIRLGYANRRRALSRGHGARAAGSSRRSHPRVGRFARAQRKAHAPQQLAFSPGLKGPILRSVHPEICRLCRY